MLARSRDRLSRSGSTPSTPERHVSRALAVSALVVAMLLVAPGVSAQELALPKITIDSGPAGSPQHAATALQILALLTILTLAPSLLIC